MTTMDHADATLTGAAERYVIGDMEEQERERYEAHFFCCADCADEVRAAARFVENARPLLHAVPDPAVSVWRAPARVTGPSWWDALVASFRVPLGAAAAGLVLVGIVAYQSRGAWPGAGDFAVIRRTRRDADAESQLRSHVPVLPCRRAGREQPVDSVERGSSGGHRPGTPFAPEGQRSAVRALCRCRHRDGVGVEPDARVRHRPLPVHPRSARDCALIPQERQLR